MSDAEAQVDELQARIAELEGDTGGAMNMINPWAKNGRKRRTDVDRSAKRRNGTSLNQSTASTYLRRCGLRTGSLLQHMTDDKITWLARNVPAGMTVGEFLVTALLDDAMAEDET